MFDGALNGAPPDGFFSLCDKHKPIVFIILGSCFGPIARETVLIRSWPFASFTGMPSTGIAGHKGLLSLGFFGNSPILLAEGRIHFYEGHSRERTLFFIRLAKKVGCKWAIITNAAGGIQSQLGPGKIMLIERHLILVKENYSGSAFSALQGEPYDKGILEKFDPLISAKEISKGTYAMVSGPNYETPSEIRYLKTLGAGAVGMSTAWEAEEAQRLGMKAIGISGITNWGTGLGEGKLTHADVIDKAEELCLGLKGFLNILFHNLII